MVIASWEKSSWPRLSLSLTPITIYHGVLKRKEDWGEEKNLDVSGQKEPWTLRFSLKVETMENLEQDEGDMSPE